MSTTQLGSQTLPPGELLGDFRITSVLGQGGFGITYKAVEETLQREVAIKEYLPQQFAFRDGTGTVQARSADDEPMFRWGLTRFLDEARTLAKFRHPNIVSVMRFFEQNGTAYLVMEFEEGMDLGQWLEGRPPPDEQRLVHGILGPLLQGLARVHDKGLLHRDIKPGNVFIRRDGSPVLLDFGAARPQGASSSQLTSIISIGYSPFEQYGTGAQQGPWTDLYALAGTMYRAISGSPPVDAIARAQGARLTPAVEAGRGRYSETLLKTIDRALSEDIARRPQDAREFLKLLGLEAPPRPQDEDATFVRPPGAAVRAKPRRRWPVALAGLCGATMIGAAAYWWIGGIDGLMRSDAAGVAAEREVAAEAEVDDAVAPNAETAPDAESTSEVATEADPRAEGATETEPEPAELEAPSEDEIVAGLAVPAVVLDFRHDQLAGALLAFTSIRSRFDDCQASSCAELPSLLQQLRSTMQPQSWQRDDDWYLVGRGKVGIGYVFAELLEPWVAPPDSTLDEALSQGQAPAAEAEDVAEVEVQMAAECFTTTRNVTLANGETEQATMTSCRTPDGWVQV